MQLSPCSRQPAGQRPRQQAVRTPRCHQLSSSWSPPPSGRQLQLAPAGVLADTLSVAAWTSHLLKWGS